MVTNVVNTMSFTTGSRSSKIMTGHCPEIKYVYKYFEVFFLLAKKLRHVLALDSGLLGCQSVSTCEE
jgi:hypothetical protein